MFGDSIPLIIALLSALVGIRGNTWNARRKGWKRLTLMGWIVAALALGSFGVAFYNAYHNRRETADALKKQSLVTAQAGQDLLSALNRFLLPLKEILDTTHAPPKDEAQLEAYVIDRHMADACDKIDAYATAEFIERLRQMPAKLCPFPDSKDPNCRLDRIVTGYSNDFQSDLETLLVRYQVVLDSDTAALVAEVKNDTMLNIFRAAASNVERNREMGKNIDEINLGWLLFGPHEPEELYLPFLQTLKKLRDRAIALARTRPNKETLFTNRGPTK